MRQNEYRARTRLNLLLGLAIRLGLAPWTEQRWDMYIWRLTGAYVYVYHVNPFWPWTGAPSINPPIVNFSYPPVWLLVILILYPFWLLNSGYAFPQNLSSLWQEGVVTGNVFESYRSFLPASLPLLDFTLKLPMIACDMVTAIVLYRVLAAHKKGHQAVTWLWLFNPQVILISAVWGQFDSIPTALSLLSVLFSLKGRAKLSGFFLALGAQAKVFPLLYLPLILVYHSKKATLVARQFLLSFLLTYVCFMPTYFLLGNGIPSIYMTLANWASPDWFGKNAISGLTWLRMINTSSWQGNFPLFPILLAPLYVTILLGCRRMKFNAQALENGMLEVTLALYLSYTIINEQYALWFIPFAIIAFQQNRALRWGPILLSGVAFAYAFLHYDLFYFLSPLISQSSSPQYAWISSAWKSLANSGILSGLALTYSFIAAAYLTVILLRQAFPNALVPIASKLNMLIMAIHSAHKAQGHISKLARFDSWMGYAGLSLPAGRIRFRGGSTRSC